MWYLHAQASLWESELVTANLHVRHEHVIKDSDCTDVDDVERAHEMSVIHYVCAVWPYVYLKKMEA